MPSIGWKNTVYKAAMSCLSPLHNHDRIYSVKPSDELKAMIKRRRLQSATLLWHNSKEPLQEVRTGCQTIPVENAWYHAASIAKMVTSVGALTLVQKGILPLDEPVGDYSKLPLPSQVTLRHLLTHTSGIVDGVGYGAAVSQRLPLDQWMKGEAYFSEYKPGEHFQYSNLGFGLIGSLMEEATNLPLDRLMQEILFMPLAMEATYDLSTLQSAAQVVSSRRLFPPARGWALNGAERKAHAVPLKTADPFSHYGLAAGGLFITANGLGKLITYLANPDTRFFSTDLYRQMITPVVTQHFGSYSCGFGMGVFCLMNAKNTPIYGHQGFAYGAVQGAFWQPNSKDWAISLNGGADESRNGRLGNTNLDVINTLLGEGTWI